MSTNACEKCCVSFECGLICVLSASPQSVKLLQAMRVLSYRQSHCLMTSKSCIDCHDFTVAIWKNSSNAGHTPQKISRVCWCFVQKSGSKIICIISGDRWWREDWVVLSYIYIFRGRWKHHDRLITLVTKLKPYFKLSFLKLLKIHGQLHVIMIFAYHRAFRWAELTYLRTLGIGGSV